MKPIDIPVADKTIIRVQETEYQGKTYVDVRKFYKDATGEWKPTKKGMFIDAKAVDAVSQALILLSNNKTAVRQKKHTVKLEDKFYAVLKRVTKTSYNELHHFETIKEALKYEPLPNHVVAYVIGGKYKLRASFDKELRQWNRDVDKTKVLEIADASED